MSNAFFDLGTEFNSATSDAISQEDNSTQDDKNTQADLPDGTSVDIPAPRTTDARKLLRTLSADPDDLREYLQDNGINVSPIHSDNVNALRVHLEIPV